MTGLDVSEYAGGEVGSGRSCESCDDEESESLLVSEEGSNGEW